MPLPSLPLALDVRWEFAGLAIVATLLTAGLLVSIVRAAIRHERRDCSGPRRQDRRRRHSAGRPDPREALALVGEALAATHNPRALLPVILNVITEATEARGGRLVHGGQEIGWVGEADGNGEQLEFELSADAEVGVTTLVLYPPAAGFSVERRQLAEWLASQASIALDNARLHGIVQHQAMTDELTGLVNRRRFISALEAEIGRATTLGGLLSVILVDLDDFKRINDLFGHHAGDGVLQGFAALLLAHAGDHELRVTASFGVAQYAVGQSGDELLRIADGALYRAKEQGKNSVCS